MTAASPPETPEKSSRFAHDGLFWRRLARLGAAHGPAWLVEYSPPLIGVAVALALPSVRRAVRGNLRRIRGPVGRVRDTRDVVATFATYAGCMAEVLSNGSKNAELPDLGVIGKPHMDRVLAAGKGVILATAHTAGWELVGPVFKERNRIDVMMVMEAERDGAARELHDRARRATGIELLHVGSDPFSSLPLLHRLRDGGALALQIDRVPDGMRGIPVRMFGEMQSIPEGPLRLAQLSGAPIVPLFCARLGYRSYFAEVFEPVYIPRRPAPGVLEASAQKLADAMSDFVSRHPTQWFDFGGQAKAAPTR
jgi:lauroyl/myristoyl acyltransferase